LLGPFLSSQSLKMQDKEISMKIINPNCAGIDVGSRSHFVAIGQGAAHVKEFGVYAEDLKELSNWLLARNITSVAMESTGTYWQNLFVQLMNSGIEVILWSLKKQTLHIKCRSS